MDQVATVARYFELASSGQVDEALALYHPDVVLHEPDCLPFGGEHVGIDGLRGLIGQVTGPFELTVRGVDYSAGEGAVIARMDTVFTSRKSGREVEMPVVEFYEFADDGLISRVDIFYKDPVAIIELGKD